MGQIGICVNFLMSVEVLRKGTLPMSLSVKLLINSARPLLPLTAAT